MLLKTIICASIIFIFTRKLLFLWYAHLMSCHVMLTLSYRTWLWNHERGLLVCIKGPDVKHYVCSINALSGWMMKPILHLISLKRRYFKIWIWLKAAIINIYEEHWLHVCYTSVLSLYFLDLPLSETFLATVYNKTLLEEFNSVNLIKCLTFSFFFFFPV